LSIKLRWGWVSATEKELRYSRDGGKTWFPIGTEPNPFTADSARAMPEAAAKMEQPVPKKERQLRGLGRGLDALLDPVKPAAAAPSRKRPSKRR
jgi:hypothetical protein